MLAAAAGVGFGVFQTLNRRGVGGIADAYMSTFMQLVVALVVLAIATAATEDLDVVADASAASLVYFALAGLVHFFAGWTFLNMSQMRIGAARTSPLLATTPVFGAALAAVTLAELPAAVTWAGVALVTAGALLVSTTRVSTIGWGVGWRDSLPGVAAALAWAVSPLFIKEGLEGLPSPLIGLTLGMAVSVGAYAAALPFRPRVGDGRIASREAILFKLAAGVMVGLSVWARWVALDHTTVAVVLALGLLSVPVVLVFSPVLMGRHVERVTPPVWAGGALVVGGGLLLVLTSS